MKTGRPPMPVGERLKRLSRREGDCLLFTGAVSNRYAQIEIQGVKQMAHRVAYELAKGPIPAGLELDHTCKRPTCINSEHLEPVTGRVNILRSDGPASRNAKKTTCPQGHSYDMATTKRRHCKQCRAEAQRRYRTNHGAEYREKHRQEEQSRRTRLRSGVA